MIAALFFVFGFASCKTETDDDPTYYTVTIAESIANGTVTADNTSAVAGDTIKLTATPANGYALDSFSVTDANTNAITVTNGAFTMPASNVTVSATFKETADTVNQKAADAVIAKITAIGTVAYTSESKEKIDDASAAYDALTETQKALIPAETLALLTAAETKYAELKAAAEQKTAGSISYATASVSKTTDDAAFTNELTKTGDGTVSYASSKEAVATVNATTGEVTIKGAGTATITATVTDSTSYTYATKTASYTLTVTVAGISVTGITISNAPTEALFVNSTGTLTATVSPDNATDKTIVWSSSDSDYVSINAETGEYTIMGTKGYGSATITATATNGTEDTSDDVTATCTITGKVTYTSLKAGDVLHVGDTFYVGQVYFDTLLSN